ncbi:unnamed protein product [Effrenium voratum]|nr:unnamed protein product [Effrenium voratum]
MKVLLAASDLEEAVFSAIHALEAGREVSAWESVDILSHIQDNFPQIFAEMLEEMTCSCCWPGPPCSRSSRTARSVSCPGAGPRLWRSRCSACSTSTGLGTQARPLKAGALSWASWRRYLGTETRSSTGRCCSRRRCSALPSQRQSPMRWSRCGRSCRSGTQEKRI